MSLLGLSGHGAPSPPDPPRDPDSEAVGLPPELGDKTPLGRLVRFLIAAVLGGGAFAVPLWMFPSIFVDLTQGFARRPFSDAHSAADAISSLGLPIGLGVGLAAGACAAIWGDAFLARTFRILRSRRTRP